MREILFRGKTIKDGKWVEGFYLFDKDKSKRFFSETDNGNYIATFIPNRDGAIWLECIIPETVGQYTGLVDKNGNKIFEGDICKHRSNFSGKDIISVVNYTDGQFLAMADNNSGFNLSDKLEVIGEHPTTPNF